MPTAKLRNLDHNARHPEIATATFKNLPRPREERTLAQKLALEQTGVSQVRFVRLS